MYVYKLDGSEWKKSEQNKSNSSNSYAKSKNNKSIETDKIVAI